MTEKEIVSKLKYLEEYSVDQQVKEELIRSLYKLANQNFTNYFDNLKDSK